MRRIKKIRPSIQRRAPQSTQQLAFDFSVSLDGYEGPMDVLLMLARRQQVNVRAISITQLAEQYLHFISQAQSLNLELAADYLVMAAWLTFLKSRLLLPTPVKLADEPAAEELASLLHMKLLRLDAMRRAAEILQQRPLIGVDVFLYGAAQFETEAPKMLEQPQAIAEYSLFDLLKAYTQQCEKRYRRAYDVPVRTVWSLQDSKEKLTSILPLMDTPTELLSVVKVHFQDDGEHDRVSAISSTLNAALELSREGQLDLTQAALFEPLYLKSKPGAA